MLVSDLLEKYLLVFVIRSPFNEPECFSHPFLHVYVGSIPQDPDLERQESASIALSSHHMSHHTFLIPPFKYLGRLLLCLLCQWACLSSELNTVVPSPVVFLKYRVDFLIY